MYTYFFFAMTFLTFICHSVEFLYVKRVSLNFGEIGIKWCTYTIDTYRHPAALCITQHYSRTLTSQLFTFMRSEFSVLRLLITQPTHPYKRNAHSHV